MIKRITTEEYLVFEREHFADPIRRMHLRLGQSFIGKMFPQETDPELFYETDQTKAKEIIFEHYVETSKGEQPCR